MREERGYARRAAQARAPRFRGRDVLLLLTYK